MNERWEKRALDRRAFLRGGLSAGAVATASLVASPVPALSLLKVGENAGVSFSGLAWRPEDFASNPADDGPALQKAIDKAEGKNGYVELDGNKTYRLRSTVYLGNVSLKTNGALLYGTSENFTLKGTARRRMDTLLLTKSAVGAGYSTGPVDIEFDVLNLKLNKIGIGPRCPLILENTERVKGTKLISRVYNSSALEANPLDFFQGVQGIELGEFDATLINHQAAPGGVWIRNNDLERPTRGIHIGKATISGVTTDELLAVFASGGSQADVSDVRFDTLNLNSLGGGAGKLLSIGSFRPSRYSPDLFRSISIGELNGSSVDLLRPGFFVSVSQCAARFGTVNLVLPSKGELRTDSWLGIYHSAAPDQTEHPNFDSVNFSLNRDVSGKSFLLLLGQLDANSVKISGPSHGWDCGAYGTGRIRNAQFDIEFASYSISGADSFQGATTGVIKDVREFHGEQTISVDDPVCRGKGAALHITTSMAAAEIIYDTRISLRGRYGPFPRLILTDPRGGSPLGIAARIQVDDPGNLGFANPDQLDPRSYFTAYDVTRVVNGKVVRLDAGTQHVSSGKLSIGAPVHSVSTSDFTNAAGLAFIQPGRFDGQILGIWAANSYHTITVHNAIGNVDIGRDIALSAEAANVDDVLWLRWSASSRKWIRASKGGWDR